MNVHWQHWKLEGQNSLSDGSQTGERRRVRMPPVENVGRSRVVTSLYPRLMIDGHLVSYDWNTACIQHT